MPWLFINVILYNLKLKAPLSFIADSRSPVGSNFLKTVTWVGKLPLEKTAAQVKTKLWLGVGHCVPMGNILSFGHFCNSLC